GLVEAGMSAQVLGEQLLVTVAAEKQERNAARAQVFCEWHDTRAVQIDVEHGDVHRLVCQHLERALQAGHDRRYRAAVTVDEISQTVGDHEVVLDDEDARSRERKVGHVGIGATGISISQRSPWAANRSITVASAS